MPQRPPNPRSCFAAEAPPPPGSSPLIRDAAHPPLPAVTPTSPHLGRDPDGIPSMPGTGAQNPGPSLDPSPTPSIRTADQVSGLCPAPPG